MRTLTVFVIVLTSNCGTPGLPIAPPEISINPKKIESFAAQTFDSWAPFHRSGPAELPNYGIVMVAEVSDESAGALKFSIKNPNADILIVDEHALPWVAPRFEFYAVTRNGVVLRRSLPISVPLPPKWIPLGPGETISGTYDASRLLEDLPDARIQDDVIVFWSYLFRPRELTKTRVNGSIVLPQLPRT